MTIAEQLLQEGMQRGIQQGRRALLCRLLEVKFGELSAHVRERLDAADTVMLDRLAERLVTARSLEELFGE